MKMSFLIGAGVGYVLGAKAGRARYEQIMRVAHNVMSSPKVQKAAGKAQAQAFEFVDKAKAAVGQKVGWHQDSANVTVTATLEPRTSTDAG